MILFNIAILLYVQASLPETSPFLSAQMAFMSTFFQVFIVLGMYNFELSMSGRPKKLPCGFFMTIIQGLRAKTCALRALG